MTAIPAFTRQEDQPLHPHILYNRPVTRRAGGRLLVVGGHTGEFSQITAIHSLSTAAGVGECSAALPDSLARLLGGAPGTYFVPSTTSGSLAPAALGRILELSEDADAVMIGPSLSNNSNTSILVEHLAAQIERPLIIGGDALMALKHHVQTVTSNHRALLVLTMAEVFKLCGQLGIPIQIRPGAGLINKLEIIQDLAAACACTFAVYGSEVILATERDLIVTPINYRLSLAPALFPSLLGTFWLQNLAHQLAGLTTGAYIIREVGKRVDATQHPGTSQLEDLITTVQDQLSD